MLVSLKNMLHTKNTENMPICHKVSTKGQGQGHRNKKLAQIVFLFSCLKFLIQNMIQNMPFKLKKKRKKKSNIDSTLQGQCQGHLN